MFRRKTWFFNLILREGSNKATLLPKCVPYIIMLAYQIQPGHRAQYLSFYDSSHRGNSPRPAETIEFSEVGYQAMSGPKMQ